MNKYKGVMMIARTFKAFSGRTGSVYPIESSGFQGQLENKNILPLSGASSGVRDGCLAVCEVKSVKIVWFHNRSWSL
jgi:hypothetical protein